MTTTKKKSSKPNDFREIRKYYAAAMKPSEKALFHEELKNNSKKYFQIGNLSNASSFFKYFNLDTALKCLKKGNLQFVEPSRWQDKYERRFYEADYSPQNTKAEECPLLYATCMSTSRFNEAAWQLYTYNKTGLGAFCVEIQINKHKFRQQLAKAINNGDIVYEGVVMYCSPKMINNLHYKKDVEKGCDIENKHYNQYVKRRDGISYINNYLNLLLMKRLDFQHEKETRFFIVKEGKKGDLKAQRIIDDEKVYYGGAVLLDIDWVEVIEKVFVNAKEESLEYELLSDTLRQILEKKFMTFNDALWQNIGGRNIVIDPNRRAEMEQIWNERLKPETYFVYGEPLEKPLVMGEDKEPSDDNHAASVN